MNTKKSNGFIENAEYGLDSRYESKKNVNMRRHL